MSRLASSVPRLSGAVASLLLAIAYTIVLFAPLFASLGPSDSQVVHYWTGRTEFDLDGTASGSSGIPALYVLGAVTIAFLLGAAALLLLRRGQRSLTAATAVISGASVASVLRVAGVFVNSGGDVTPRLGSVVLLIAAIVGIAACVMLVLSVGGPPASSATTPTYQPGPHGWQPQRPS